MVISKNIDSETYRYLVAVQAKSIVGVIVIKDNRHLHHLFVDKEYQGQGIARKLWEAASNQSMSMGNKGNALPILGMPVRRLRYIDADPLQKKWGLLP